MPILSPVEARSARGRFIQTVVTLSLIIGGATMIYPFLIMVSGATRSPMDEARLNLVPSFLVDDVTLTRKFLETKYNQDIDEMNQARRGRDYAFESASVPERVVPQRVADYERFLTEETVPFHWRVLGATHEARGRLVPARLREMRSRLSDRYEGDLQALSDDIGAPLNNWYEIKYPPPEWASQQYDHDGGPLAEVYRELYEEAAPGDTWPVSLTGYFLQQSIYPSYGQSDVARYNAAHARSLDSYDALRLPRRVPGEDQPTLREEWIVFVRESLNATFVRLEGVEDEAYRTFVRQRYDTVEGLNRVWNTEYGSFEDVQLPGAHERVSGALRSDYRDFVDQQPPEHWVLVGLEFAWSDWLEANYDSLEALNQAHEASYDSFAAAPPPVGHVERAHVEANAGSLRWSFATRNFVNVFNEMILQGRPFLNTVIFVTLAIVTALLLMPMAAYALSRYRLPGTYRILLVLLATTAFPPMVGLIPQFLMLRHLGLLNTFIALVLPIAINGYWVFLLKGFFDSLPSELYEAARIDGASEMRMFFQITMSLSKPILAVLGLNVFNAAYMMFLYALIVAPSEDMWILSVWLYQYQQEASMAGVFAAVLIAAIPTLVVFLVAQRTIMRGIVIPTEK